MPRLFQLPALCLLGLLALPCAHAAAPDALPWDSKTQGDFVVSLARDRQGNIWAGTEDAGVSRYNPRTHQWIQFTTKDGLGDDDIYALACDLRGRVWAGTLNHGVSVWNGKAWKTYDRLTGPLGAHVTALAVNPLDGSVWGATEAGLFRYAHEQWTYFTRAEGLPSDQANALAFDKHGTLYVGTACDGLAISSAASGYKTWRRVTGPDALPNSPSGKNLPSNLVNAVLVAKDGTIYVGTDCGLAYSRDGGKSWAYVRGRDWLDKLKGLAHPPEAVQTPMTGDLLLEDYVTALAEDAAGHVWVGHRQRGAEALEPSSLGRVYPTGSDKSSDDFISALLPRLDGPMLAGHYGGGLTQTNAPGDAPALVSSVSHVASSSPAPFPTPAQAPGAASLKRLTRQVQAQQGSLAEGGAMYEGEDWVTQGDWVGHYGRQYARLCAMDHVLSCSSDYWVSGQMGPHHAAGDGLRWWVTAVQTDNPKALYTPVRGYRRQAEWDDHGEDYVNPQDGSMPYEGPDIWVKVRLLAGDVHRLSLYFVNKDAHGWTGNRYRDYLVELKPYRDTLEAADAAPTLACARVRNFWGGVYESFVVRSPGTYYVKIAKNNSTNTILSAVLIDKLAGQIKHTDIEPMAYMNDVRYDAPDPAASKGDAFPSPEIASAQALWSALDKGYGQPGDLVLQETYRLFALRAVVQARGSKPLQANWRWQLRLWTPPDREQFASTMARAWQAGIEEKARNQIVPLQPVGLQTH